MTHSYMESLTAGYLSRVARKWPTHISNPEFEFTSIQKFSEFLRDQENCYDRTNFYGHITGSAMVVNPAFTHVVLTLHKKLGKWLQLGGHSDGNPLTWQVAMTEVQEESGLDRLSIISPLTKKPTDPAVAYPLDLDIHLIPARKNDPAHFHFDVRFLIMSETTELKISDESDDLRWFALEEIKNVTDEESTLRQVAKIIWLNEQFPNP